MKLAFLVFAVAFFGGCASGAVSKSMVPKDLTVANIHPYSVTVKVEGGRETDAAGTPQISSQEFQAAIVESLTTYGVFKTVLTEGNIDYKLEAAILNLQQPLFGFNMTVTIETVWKLTNLKGGSTVMRENLTNSFSATPGDAFAAVTWLRLATEGAARENIRDALKKISEKKTLIHRSSPADDESP
ncbi:MAG: hypothetical protein E4G97_05980 [Deltaproteobacteria bacterium]|nr:MAG: hypothetical protein E4G97_05980 [Deltaproteobacteria bacterium]